MPRERIAAQSSSVGSDAPGGVGANVVVPAFAGAKLSKPKKARKPRASKKTLKLASGTVSGIMTPPRG